MMQKQTLHSQQHHRQRWWYWLSGIFVILLCWFGWGCWHSRMQLQQTQQQLAKQQRLVKNIVVHKQKHAEVTDRSAFDKLQNQQIKLLQTVFTKMTTFTNTSTYNGNRSFILGVCGDQIGNQLMPSCEDTTGHSQVQALQLKSYTDCVVCYPQQPNQWLVQVQYYLYTNDDDLLNLDAMVPTTKWFMVTTQGGKITQCQAQTDIRCIN